MFIWNVWIAKQVSRLNALTKQYLILLYLQESLESTYSQRSTYLPGKTNPRSNYFLGKYDSGIGISL